MCTISASVYTDKQASTENLTRSEPLIGTLFHYRVRLVVERTRRIVNVRNEVEPDRITRFFDYSFFPWSDASDAKRISIRRLVEQNSRRAGC